MYVIFNKSFSMGYLSSVLKLRCPKCRTGKMFQYKPYRFKGVSSLHKNCPHCGTSYQLEPSFFYGSMYVSYALGVALAVAVYVLLLIFGLGKNAMTSFIVIAVTIIFSSPYIYQLSKVIWASFFIKFDSKKTTKI